MEMEKRMPGTRVVPEKCLETFSRHVLDTFLQRLSILMQGGAELYVHHDSEAYLAEASCSASGPVCCERMENAIRLHICVDGLAGITETALEGWIEHELMLWLLRYHYDIQPLNFKRQIFPLMPVSGLAENYLLELVNSLETGLSKYLAVKALVEMDAGISQVEFLFFTIASNGKERAHYLSTSGHSWTNALFLCRKLRELLTITCLASRNVGFSRDLISWWWKTHDYLDFHDRSFLEAMADIPDGSDSPYNRQVVELFKAVKVNYLAPNKTSTTKISTTLQ